MNFIIKVTNKRTAEVIKFDIPYIVISIYSTNSQPAKIPLHPKCLDVLSIQFDDVDSDDWQIGCKSITEKQANQIWTFVDYYLQRNHTNPKLDNTKAELILIHCNAGVCRSPALAAAISRIYTGEDKEWFQKPYLPNMKVYNTMLKVELAKEVNVLILT